MERGSCNLHFDPVIHILGFTVNTLCDYWTADIETIEAQTCRLAVGFKYFFLHVYSNTQT